MGSSHAQTPSLAHPELPDPDCGPGFHTRSRPAAQPAARDRPRHPPHRPTTTDTGANTMSQRLQIVLPDPIATAAPGARRRRRRATSHARGPDGPRRRRQAAKNGQVRTVKHHPARRRAKQASARAGLSPTAATPIGERRCGADPRAPRQIPPAAAQPQRRLVERRRPCRDPLRARRMAQRARRHGEDPREELAFHTQITDYARTLGQEGGGVTKNGSPERHRTRGPLRVIPTHPPRSL